MFCLTDQDCDSKWTKIKRSLRSHQQSPPFSKVGAAQRALRRGLTFDIGGKTLNIITSGQQTLNGVKMNRQKANKTGKTREEKIDAIYLLFLRTLFSCDAYDGMGNISSRHLPVSQQTLPDIANPGTCLSDHTGQWSRPTLLRCHARYCLIWLRTHQHSRGIFLHLRLLFPYQHNWFTL